MRHTHDETRPSDIRRRLRAKNGVAHYTLRQLAEALHRKKRYIAGAHIVLIGFSGHTDPHARAECEEMITMLRRFGAHLHIVSAEARDYADFRVELQNALRKADAALVDVDSRFFKALRPKELRALGVDIVIPTSLRA